MANNLKKLDNADRKELAESPELLNIMVAAYGVRGDLLENVREATSVDDAKDRAKAAMAELGAPPATDATVSDVYAATGEGPTDNMCKPPLRWDPITQTCVPIGAGETNIA